MVIVSGGSGPFIWFYNRAGAITTGVCCFGSVCRYPALAIIITHYSAQYVG